MKNFRYVIAALLLLLPGLAFGSPSITSLSPTSGPVGTSVTITGSGFGTTQGSSTVKFNGTVATVTSWSSGTVKATVPSAATTGNVVVTVSGVASNGKSFTVTPAISSLSVTFGPVSTAVTITGTTFGSSQGSSTVKFNGTTATVTSWSSSTIKTTVPSAATTGNVVVTVSSNASNGINFTVTPAITSISPTSGVVGTSVTITGTTFGSTQGSSTVKFNGVAATPTLWSATSIKAPAPAGATTGNVVVTVAGNASNGKLFTVPLGSFKLTSGNLVNARYNHTATLLKNGQVLLVGGNGSASPGPSNFILASAELYNPSTGTFSATGSLNLGRVNHAATLLDNGQVLVTGGEDVNFNITASAELYDPLAGTFTTTGSLNTARTAATATLLNNGLVLVAGGSDGSNDTVSAAELYNPVTGTFTATGSLNTARRFHTATLLNDGTVLMAGGADSSGMPLSSAEVYDPVAGTFSAVGSLANARESGTATLLDDGTVLIAGGSNDGTAPSEIYSPSSKTFSSTGSLTTGRTSSTGTLLGNGMVLIAGGNPSQGNTLPLNSELYSPATGTFLGGANLNTGRQQAAATLLPDGTVMVAGGSDNNSNPIATAEIYQPDTLAPANLQSIAIGPSGPTIDAGNSLGLVATGTFGNNSTQTLASAIWSSANTTVATITNDAKNHGHIFGASSGSATVSACTGSICGSTTVTIVQLSVTGVSPTSGAVGTSVTISGNGFGSSQGSSTVTFNGIPASPTAWSQQSITVPVPTAATSGSLVVSVGSQTANGGTFTVVPVINSLSPTYGPVGASVTVSGSGFGLTQSGSTVAFNGTTASATSWGAGSIAVSVPAGSTDGNVVVTVGGVSSNGVPFALNPIITSLSPSSGLVGTTVTITGTNFGASQGSVSFNGQTATISSWSTSSISVVVPGGASSGSVVVTTGPQQSNAVPFTVGPIVYANERTLTLDHTKVPNTDQANFPALISGQFGFLAAVAHGGKVQNPNGWDIIFSSDAAGTNKLDHEIETYDPVTGTINFWVRVPLLSHLADTVIYVQYGSGAVLTSQENKTGVWDSNYQMVLHLGEAAAPYHDSTANGYTGVSAGTPALAAGKVGNGQSFANSYIAFPASPSPNQSITMETWIQSSERGQSGILGKWGNDNNNNSDYSYLMYFGGNPTANFNSVDGSGTSVNVTGSVVVNDGQWHHLVATANAVGNALFFTDGVQTGSVAGGHPLLATTTDRFLIGAAGLDFLSFPFMTGSLDEVRISSSTRSADWLATEYNNESSPASFYSAGRENGPSISSLSPSSGEPGATITIAGSGFTSTTGTVSFNGVAATVTSWSNSSISAVIPMTATSGPVVITAGGVQTNAVGFTVLLPTITAINPTSGDPGTAVVIQGANFDPAQGSGQVAFNGISASIASWSAISITAYVPAGATTGSVVVTAPNGVSSNGVSFTVTDNMAITLISPASGPAGTTVTIFGGGFGSTQGSSTVAFNGNPAAVTSWNENEIVATVPPGTATGPVTLTLGGGTMAWSVASFVVDATVQVTDSLGNNSSYTSAILGGTWQNMAATGSGCSSCTVRGNIEDTYDASGNLLTHTDELGHVTTYTYDANNNPASQSIQLDSTTTVATSYTYNSFGEVLTMTDPLGQVTTSTYDSSGNLLTVTTPAPNSNTPASATQFAYNSRGELTQITDPLNNVSKLAYTPAGFISTITDAQNNVTTYQYDGHGNRTSITDALQNTTGFAYDAMDRLVTITYPDHTTAGFGYDYRGRRTTVTDQNSKTTTYAYDDADRLTSVTDAANHATQYSYDTENNLLSITDANNNVTSFAYDAFGRVTQTTFPSTYTESYTYDAAGNLTSKLDRKGQAILYVYDALNRLTFKEYPDSTDVEYVYDLAGKIKQVTDPTGSYGFAYDNMGRLIGTTTQYTFLPSVTFSNSYGYDANSNRTSFTAPDGSTNTYQYDTLNRLSTLTNSLTGQFTFGYDALSRRTSLSRPNGVVTSYGYDSLSRLLTVLHQNGTATLDGAVYAYDNAGNRTGKTNQLNGVSEQYTYDAVYQLLQVTQSATTTENYTYDSVGNRLSSLNAPQWNYNTSNELTSNSSASFAYDKNGNTMTKVISGSTTQYTWDFDSRLTSAVMPGSGGTGTFKYDPFGRRIQKAFTQGPTTTTTNYVYDGPNSVEEVDQSGNLLARYTQGADIDQPLSELRLSTAGYYEQDGLGSVTSLSSSTGSLSDTYAYDGFGNLATSTGSAASPFQYTGRDYDLETGLRYYRARYYDSKIGRFLSEDPRRFFGGVNPYRYVANSSPNLVDAFGMTGSHPASLDSAWNQARALLSDPDCSKFLKDVLTDLHDIPDLDLFLQNFDNLNFGYTPKNDRYPDRKGSIAHIDSITMSPSNNIVHVNPDAAGPKHCCIVGVTLLHEVLHTYPYAFTDFQIATAAGYKGSPADGMKPASVYFSRVMEDHCVKGCQK